MIKNTKIEIGQHFYGYASFVLLEYVIIEIQKITTLNNEKTFYIAECLSCKHGKNCIVAFTYNDFKELAYSHMVNDDGQEKQFYWHNSEPEFIFATKKDAEIYVTKMKIEEKEKHIIKYKDEITKLTKEIDNITNILNALIENDDNQKQN